MNCHFPQNDLGRAEAEHIASTNHQYLAPTDGSPLRGLIQDHVDGGVKLCGKDTFLNFEEYQQLIFSFISTLPGLEVISVDENVIMVPPAIQKPQKLWTGKQVITTLLNHLRRSNDRDDYQGMLPGISIEVKAKTPAAGFGEAQMEHKVLIKDGELLRGVLDKNSYGATSFSVVHAVQEAYGPHKAALLLNCFGRLFTGFLQMYSMHSCRMEDLVLTAKANEARAVLVAKAYNEGMRAAKAWADSDGGKTAIHDSNLSAKPLKPVEHAATCKKIQVLLSGKEGANNASALDSYMMSKINPLASTIIKTCLPDGLAVPFPKNTFALMVTTGAKGSIVNQSQVSCGLGQQALEGRRVPRMSSGRTLPSFAPYDPNPRADGFITDRFLTGVRPQEYYFHCMAGREGLVDTAVKTSRSGYLQRCLVKHLEELKVEYDHTVRDAEGNVVQFLYGEDGVDCTKASHLDCSGPNLEYFARNEGALLKRYGELEGPATLDLAIADAEQSKKIAALGGRLATGADFVKGEIVLARKLRYGASWTVNALCTGWVQATIKKVHKSGKSFDLKYIVEKETVKDIPFSLAAPNGGNYFMIKKFVNDPIIGGNISNRMGTHGSIVSERVATKTRNAINNDEQLKKALEETGISAGALEALVAKKYSASLVAPGEAVGSIAAQSVGEPSTQMTLNTFHLAGHGGANVTLGIPRLREILMSASRELKTPLMSVPFVSGVSQAEQKVMAQSFDKLTLMELLSSVGGIVCNENVEQGAGGLWQRTYEVTLKLHSEERIQKSFKISYESVAVIVAKKFITLLKKKMSEVLKKAKLYGGEMGDITVNGSKSNSVGLSSGDGDDDDEDEPQHKKISKRLAKDAKDNEYDDEEVGEEDGTSRFGHKKEMASYGDMDDEEIALAKQSASDDSSDSDDETTTKKKASAVSDDDEEVINKTFHPNEDAVKLNKKTGELVLAKLDVDVSAQPLLMVGLAEEAAKACVVRSRPGINKGQCVEQVDRGMCLQTEGQNFTELLNLSDEKVKHHMIKSNDIWAIHETFGVEAARQSIVNEIKGVFAVYGISVDHRHLSLIADYMTHNGDYKPLNRRGMVEGSSAFLQMSFETTATFMTEHAMNKQTETLQSPSANIVMGNPIKHGTGAFECIIKVGN